MSAAPFTIRDARLHDLDVIVRYNRALAEESEDLRLDESTITAGVAAILGDPSKGRYFVADEDGRVIGQLMITYEWSDWRNGMFLWIQSVYVAQDRRRQGVFAALYRHVEALSRQPGHCGIRLYVADHNQSARATYTGLGMTSPGYLILETPDRLREEPV